MAMGGQSLGGSRASLDGTLGPDMPEPGFVGINHLGGRSGVPLRNRLNVGDISLTKRCSFGLIEYNLYHI